ncbi:MAG: hypothetical protein HYS13_06585, partial [Planctomycetia bacterium]|nr:hypothetical protein [Planctomycetia bacterium]
MLQPRRFASRAAAAIVVLCAIVAGDEALQAGQVSSDARATRHHKGYSVKLDTDWPQTGGYRPLLMKLTPKESVPYDRTMRVEILLQNRGNYYSRVGDLLVYQDVFIPRGTPANQSLQVPLTVP